MRRVASIPSNKRHPDVMRTTSGRCATGHVDSSRPSAGLGDQLDVVFEVEQRAEGRCG